MLRARHKKHENASILTCDRGGHRLELDINGVEKMVSAMLSLCCDPKVVARYRKRYPKGTDFYKAGTNQSMANKKRREFVVSLQELMANIKDVPRVLLAQVHQTLGIIHQRLNNAAKAKKAFLQTLWIQSSMVDSAPIDLGLTKVALSLEYAKFGEFKDAIPTLESAVRDFQKGSLDESSDIWTLVSNAMSTFHLAKEKNRIMATMQEKRGVRKSFMVKTASVPVIMGERKHLPRSKTPPLASVAGMRNQI